MNALDELGAATVELVKHHCIITLAALNPRRKAPGLREQGRDFRPHAVVFPVARTLSYQHYRLAVANPQSFPTRRKLADVVGPCVLPHCARSGIRPPEDG